MRFRPCIDLRKGKVTQIVGSTLKDDAKPSSSSSAAAAAADESSADTNFETAKPSSFFATLYREHNLAGGHVIMLGPGNEEAALSALRAYPGGMQVGGGVNPANAPKYLEAGASAVIVTSYVFKDGEVNMERLNELINSVGGPDKLVLDLSCRKSANGDGFEYVVVTDRWQKWTNLVVNEDTLKKLGKHCCEFLVHGVDVEGLRQGIEEELVATLGKHSPVPVTYAGGVRDFNDLEKVRKLGEGKVDITIGSALDIFGGDVAFEKVVQWHNDLQ